MKKLGLYNLKIHYTWTFLSSIAFLSPVMSLYYQKYNLQIPDILRIGSFYTTLLVILEIPTSTLGDNWGRSKTLLLSSLSSFCATGIYYFFPGYLGFYIAIFFLALGQALWSGTGQAKLQEDLKVAEMTKDFGKIIGRLISIQKVGQLGTPVIIYFILKFFPNNGYHYLALFDLFIWIFVVFIVSKFKEINTSYKRIGKTIKENIYIQFGTIKESLIYILGNKKLLHFLYLFLFSNNFFYISSIFYPALTNFGFKDYHISYIVWLSSVIMIVGSWKAYIFGKKFSWKNSWGLLMFFNSILNILLFIYWGNIVISIIIYLLLVLITSLNSPIRQHIFMDLTDIRTKATTRSLILSVYAFYQSLMLVFLSLYPIQTGIFISFIISFIGLIIFGLLKFNK